MKLRLPPHLEHLRPQLEALQDAGGEEALLVLKGLGLSLDPPKKLKLHCVKRGELEVRSHDLTYAKQLAKELNQCPKR